MCQRTCSDARFAHAKQMSGLENVFIVSLQAMASPPCLLLTVANSSPLFCLSWEPHLLKSFFTEHPFNKFMTSKDLWLRGCQWWLCTCPLRALVACIDLTSYTSIIGERLPLTDTQRECPVLCALILTLWPISSTHFPLGATQGGGFYRLFPAS